MIPDSAVINRTVKMEDHLTDALARATSVDIDVTARVKSNGSIYDVFCECKMRRRQTGFTELNVMTERVELTGANVNPRYMLFSPSGFTDDLRDHAESRRDLMLIDPPMLMGDIPPRPI